MKNILIPLIVMSFLLSGCGGGATEPAGPAELQISDPAKQLEAVAGNEFKIVIQSNPSTGYHWEIIGDLDTNVVEYVSNGYQGDEPVMPGSGGADIWTFKAIAPGETKITLGYYPPSNEPTDPQQTVTFTVTVK